MVGRMSIRISHKLLSATALAVFLSSLAQTARAQYWSSYGYGLGTSLLYPLTYLPYQLLYGYRYGSSGYAPNNLLYQASYAPYGYLPYGGKFGLGNSTNQPYTNSGQFGNGQTGLNPQGTPYNNNNFYAPNYNQPQWQNQPPSNNPANQQSQAPAKTAFSDPFAVSSPQPGRSTGVAPSSENLPPAAPDRYVKHTPLVDGFISAINAKFDGDVNRAMKDKDMYSWAQALNLVDGRKPGHVKLNETRTDAIRKILKDDSLDSESKLETLRILMK
jgi:hypothetical protein